MLIIYIACLYIMQWSTDCSFCHTLPSRPWEFFQIRPHKSLFWKVLFLMLVPGPPHKKKSVKSSDYFHFDL